MAKFVLPIKSTYVPDWGLWECLRELVQNAKDEEEQRGHAMKIEWQAGVLSLHNEGADMDRKALLIGHTGKTGSDLRGKFGEGLDLALLAGARLGKKIVVETKAERWTPTIGYSQEFGANCLAITTRARRTAGPGVTVTVEVTEEEWLLYRQRFLFLSEIADNKIVRIPSQGAILLESERKGHVYVRGIYVDTLPKLECGYDLERMDLDRDRRMVDVWDLQWRLGQMYSEALSRRPELLGAQVYRMLRDDSEDTRLFRHHTDKNVASHIAARFREEHGEDAVPVGSIAEARELEHIGRRGVVVQDALRESLKPEMGDVADLKKRLAKEVVKSIAWADLTDVERAVFDKYTAVLDRIRVLPEPVAKRIDIVVFRDDRVDGVFRGETGRITIAYRLLATPQEFLATLVHEAAHAASASGDGDHDHVQAIEDIWTRLYFDRMPLN